MCVCVCVCGGGGVNDVWCLAKYTHHYSNGGNDLPASFMTIPGFSNLSFLLAGVSSPGTVLLQIPNCCCHLNIHTV